MLRMHLMQPVQEHRHRGPSQNPETGKTPGSCHAARSTWAGCSAQTGSGNLPGWKLQGLHGLSGQLTSVLDHLHWIHTKNPVLYTHITEHSDLISKLGLLWEAMTCSFPLLFFQNNSCTGLIHTHTHTRICRKICRYLSCWYDTYSLTVSVCT